MSIRIIVTGGTFDKEYNELQGSLFFRKSHVAEMLRLGRCRLAVKVQTLFMIDSLCMTASHRKRVLAACLAAPERHIVVTHGTDTMVETARVLGPRIGDQTVVLTGAMVPYKFGSSDGLFNLGSSLSFAQSLPPGVYVAMNGRYFLWNNVRKDRRRGEFAALSRP
ncbi:MAG: asparaginase domain-containing protein [Elusimicrobia bacterium]|nr:asparaginase domain-containing protein [Elusimicrobiota bacterium]